MSAVAAESLHLFDWCSRADQDHDRCRVAYRSVTGGTVRYCECPRHTDAQRTAAAARLAPQRTAAPPEADGKGTAVRRATARPTGPMRTYECAGRTVQATSPTAAAAQLGVSRRYFRVHGREVTGDV